MLLRQSAGLAGPWPTALPTVAALWIAGDRVAGGVGGQHAVAVELRGGKNLGRVGHVRKSDGPGVRLAEVGEDALRGGGPGAGPVGVGEKLVPFLPFPRVLREADGTYRLERDGERPTSIGRMRSFVGNTGILVRAYAYLCAHGAEGLIEVSEDAVLAANYLKHRLRGAYDIPHDRQMTESGALVPMDDPRAGAPLTVSSPIEISGQDKVRPRLAPVVGQHTVEVLEEAGIREADAFIAVSSGDNSNIVSARVAREHYKVEKVIARIYDPMRARIYERLNIPTIATTRWGVQQMLLMLAHPREEMEEALAAGNLYRFRVQVPAHLVGKPVDRLSLEGKVLVAGVERGASGFIPVPSSTFQEGDVANVVIHKDAIADFDALLAFEEEA